MLDNKTAMHRIQINEIWIRPFISWKKEKKWNGRICKNYGTLNNSTFQWTIYHAKKKPHPFAFHIFESYVFKKDVLPYVWTSVVFTINLLLYSPCLGCQCTSYMYYLQFCTIFSHSHAVHCLNITSC